MMISADKEIIFFLLTGYFVWWHESFSNMNNFMSDSDVKFLTWNFWLPLVLYDIVCKLFFLVLLTPNIHWYVKSFWFWPKIAGLGLKGPTLVGLVVNMLRLGDTLMSSWNGSSFAQSWLVSYWYPASTKPLPEPMMNYCQLNAEQQNLVRIE